jgi:3-(3-hydroxy-phenyl)propionate hydroxylase
MNETIAAGREFGRHAVLVAGGGPVGMAVALALAKYGVRSTVVEADDGVCVGSRAICLSRRTLEILDRLDALEPFVEKGLPWTGGRSFYRDREVLHFTMPHDADQRLAPMTNIQQYYVEQFLLDAVRANASTIDFRPNTRVTGISSRTDGVVVDLESQGVRYEAEADYVVACDGARSTVRSALGLRMAGTSYEGRYVIADIEIDLDLPTERLAWFDPPSAPGRTILMHKQPDDLWRVDYQLHDGEDSDEMVRSENVAAVVEAHLRAIGVTRPWRMVWTSMYRAAAVSLDDYRHGRILFAGDAAHLVPIFGVRGLNSGFDDAFNLAWKLAYVAGGSAPDTLLESYSVERRFGWEVNIANAMRSTEFMAPPSRGFEVMRTAVLSLAHAHPALSALINPRQSGTIAYATSPLNTDDRVDDREAPFAGGPPPGTVLPEAPVRDASGDTYLTRTLPGDFTLLYFHAEGDLSEDIAELARCGAAAVPPWETVVLRPAESRVWTNDCPARDVIDGWGRAASVLDGRPGTAYLIRPDGHVCGRFRRVDRRAIENALRTALGYPEFASTA